jgi:hypothetical protein
MFRCSAKSPAAMSPHSCDQLHLVFGSCLHVHHMTHISVSLQPCPGCWAIQRWRAPSL